MRARVLVKKVPPERRLCLPRLRALYVFPLGADQFLRAQPLARRAAAITLRHMPRRQLSYSAAAPFFTARVQRLPKVPPWKVCA